MSMNLENECEVSTPESDCEGVFGEDVENADGDVAPNEKSTLARPPQNGFVSHAPPGSLTNLPTGSEVRLCFWKCFFSTRSDHFL